MQLDMTRKCQKNSEEPMALGKYTIVVHRQTRIHAIKSGVQYYKQRYQLMCLALELVINLSLLVALSTYVSFSHDRSVILCL